MGVPATGTSGRYREYPCCLPVSSRENRDVPGFWSFDECCCELFLWHCAARVVKLTTVLTKPTHETDLRVGFVKPESLVDPNDGEVGRELRGPCGLHIRLLRLWARDARRGRWRWSGHARTCSHTERQHEKQATYH